ncbi:MAG: coproporphyrinogen dehydrogenase HemZ [Ruminococcaceae bacterium]|nr:coproporphyrinogen dehydrogenase HemZ [Oscillospiraceae bacterium]
MQLINIGKDFKYEIEKLCRLFLPFDKFTFSSEPDEVDYSDDYCIYSTVESEQGVKLSVKLSLGGKLEEREGFASGNDEELFTLCERKLALMVFDCLKSITGYSSPWGILTGVRPAKLIAKLLKTDGEEKAVEYFRNELLVSEKKTALCLECHKKEEKAISESRPDSFSLYISVPFCPSRCNYCSFVSHSVEQAKKLIPQYVDLLVEELKYTADLAKQCGLKLMTVYVGGGTPTALSAEQLTRIFDAVKANFDLSQLVEYTVEAGRPDTVTRDKLMAIRKGGATRISINPQTMNDDVLKSIGRRHTVAQTVEAFKLARGCGFDNINMDLIAGLSGDTVQSFCDSVDKCLELDPENITVHSLSMKRASNLTGSGYAFGSDHGTDAEKMVDYAYTKLSEKGIRPYYMYRQSKTVGNLENVGYCKAGYEGLYNVYIMDETHTILACGASGVTKLREPNGNNIERVFNFKYPYEYISQFDVILKRKDAIVEFYNKYSLLK